MSREKELERLVVTLEARTAKYKKELDSARKRSKTFAKNTKKDILDIKQSIAGLGLAFAATKIVQATAKQERAIRQLEQGIKSTAGSAGFASKELVKFAGELQQATTFGDEDTIAAMSQLVTFTNITGEEFKRTTKAALDLSARMGTDLKSSVVQLGKALNDPVANLSALSRSGIQFSDEQKKLIKSFIDVGDQASAQKVILAELERQFGGSAEAARDTFGGALEALQNQMGDLLEADSGLKQAQRSIEDLTRVLGSDAVIDGINKLTSAIVGGFAGSLSFIAETINAIEFLAEEFASFINGPIIGDAVRLEDAIARVKGEIKDLESKKSRSNAGNELMRLKEELAALERKLEITNQINASDVTLDITQGTNLPDQPVLPDLSIWEQWADKYKEIMEDPIKTIEDDYIAAFDNITGSFSKMAATAIVEGGSMTDVFKSLGKTLAVDLLSSLIKVGAQMLINQAFGKTAEASSVASANIAGPAIAAAYTPAAAAVSLATQGTNSVPAGAALASTFALSASLAGMAHDGIDMIPKEGTWLLDKGERVFSAKQNEQMVSALKSGSGGVIVNNYVANDTQAEVKQGDNGLEISIRRIARNALVEDITNGTGAARAIEKTYDLTRRF